MLQRNVHVNPASVSVTMEILKTTQHLAMPTAHVTVALLYKLCISNQNGTLSL